MRLDHGLHQMTLEDREGGVVGVGVSEKGEPNTVKAPVQDYWSVVRTQAIVEPLVYFLRGRFFMKLGLLIDSKSLSSRCN